MDQLALQQQLRTPTAAGNRNKDDVIEMRLPPVDDTPSQRTGLEESRSDKYRVTDYDDQGRWQYPRRRSEARRKWPYKPTSVAKTRLATTKKG